MTYHLTGIRLNESCKKWFRILNHKQNYGLGIFMVFKRYLIMLFDFQGDGCDPHYPCPQWGGSLPPRLSGTLLHAVQECPQSSRHHYCKFCLYLQSRMIFCLLLHSMIQRCTIYNKYNKYFCTQYRIKLNEWYSSIVRI